MVAMDTAMPTTPAPPAETPAGPATPAVPPQRSRHGAGHVIAIVVGCLMLLPGLGMLVGGAVAASAQAFATEDGYFRFTLDRIDTDGSAIAATDLWLDGDTRDDGPDWLLDSLDVDLRLRVDGAAPTDEVFVGIARTPDVERYLDGVAYADVVDMDGHTTRLDHLAGSDSIGPPDGRDIWVASASGPGEQELTWDARGGRWAAVIMNADGSPGVAADVEIGVRSDAVMPVAVVLMVLGGVVLAGGIVLIVVGARGRRVPPGPVDTGSTGSPIPTAPATPTTPAAPTTASASPAPFPPPPGTGVAHPADDLTRPLG